MNPKQWAKKRYLVPFARNTPFGCLVQKVPDALLPHDANPLHPRPRQPRVCRRDGNVLVLIGFLLVVLLGMTALAVDLGYIMVTRAQLQASSDSGSLAGGTELLSGLGVGAYRTPAEVKLAAEEQAVHYVSLHPSGNAASTHIEPGRDIRLGRARLNPATGLWTFLWGETPYNAVNVDTLRGAPGQSEGDGPLPLFFARILGHDTADVAAESVAVIMPARGVRVPPGSGLASGLSPFAFSLEAWQKFQRARQHWASNGLSAENISLANDGHLILDPEDLDEQGDPLPLYYDVEVKNNSTTYRQLFADQYRVIDPDREDAANVQLGSDGVLELNIYPLNNEAGNFGTVNIGVDSNSAQVLKDQIENGIEEQYLQAYEDNTLDFDPDNPIALTGNTGISAGIQASLESIIGQKRAIALYSNVQNPGSTAIYTLVDIVGVRIMAVKLSGSEKVLVVQPESLSDPTGVPDYESEIGEETSFFSPLILAR